jgi:integrase
VTGYGKAFTPAGFTNWFSEKCTEAGLGAGLSLHGLRKATCWRLAEQGCTPHEIMSISGHTTLAEVTRYTEAANRIRLARDAMGNMIRARTSNGKPDA